MTGAKLVYDRQEDVVYIYLRAFSPYEVSRTVEGR
jgi:hypothetical protein